jgi:hypothetical protein
LILLSPFPSRPLSRDHKLPMADFLAEASALDSKATLIICDTHFQGLPGVVTL